LMRSLPTENKNAKGDEGEKKKAFIERRNVGNAGDRAPQADRSPADETSLPQKGRRQAGVQKIASKKRRGEIGGGEKERGSGVESFEKKTMLKATGEEPRLKQTNLSDVSKWEFGEEGGKLTEKAPGRPGKSSIS